MDLTSIMRAGAHHPKYTAVTFSLWRRIGVSCSKCSLCSSYRVKGTTVQKSDRSKWTLFKILQMIVSNKHCFSLKGEIHTGLENCRPLHFHVQPWFWHFISKNASASCKIIELFHSSNKYEPRVYSMPCTHLKKKQQHSAMSKSHCSCFLPAYILKGRDRWYAGLNGWFQRV